MKLVKTDSADLQNDLTSRYRGPVTGPRDGRPSYTTMYLHLLICGISTSAWLDAVSMVANRPSA